MMFISEERQIVKRIKDFIKDEEPPEDYYVMLRNGHLLDIDNYYKMASAGKINPQDAYVYVGLNSTPSRTDFYYPFLAWHSDIVHAYLSKLGFHYLYFVVPVTGLKYAVDLERYGDYLAIELLNLDTAVNITNLPKIVVEVLGKKLISGEEELTEEEYFKILDMFKSQRILAGYDFTEAWNIVDNYYDEGKKSLTKEVTRIAIAYVDIFQPYKVCYETKKWNEVDCWSIT